MARNTASTCRSSLAGILFLFLSLIVFFVYQDTQAVLETWNSSFTIQVLLFAIFFVLLAILISNNKLKKTDSVQSQVNELTNNIKEENEKLRALTRKDILTNIGNKTHFDEQFEKEFKRAIREKQYISMVMVNIDEFKSYNDLYGYEAGNKCLRQVSEILLEQCNRPTDLIARCHSDEFLILLPNTENPSIIARRCVQAVEDLQILHDNSIASNVVTISLGTSAVLAEDCEQMFAFLSKARESLKHAKVNGRNRALGL